MRVVHYLTYRRLRIEKTPGHYLCEVLHHRILRIAKALQLGQYLLGKSYLAAEVLFIIINLNLPIHNNMQYTSRRSKAYLAQGYTPAQYDIICGRGGACFQHPGNVTFRHVVDNHLDRYYTATCKMEKSLIVKDILDAVSRSYSTFQPIKFIRFDTQRQLWYEIGDKATVQKVGQKLREIICLRDPQKRAINAMKRAINYKAREQAKSKFTQKQYKDESVFASMPCSRSPPAPPVVTPPMRVTSGNIFVDDFDLASIPSMPLKSGISRGWTFRQTAEGGLSREDADLTDTIENIFEESNSMPPPLKLGISRGWSFRHTGRGGLTREDADLADTIENIFEESNSMPPPLKSGISREWSFRHTGRGGLSREDSDLTDTIENIFEESNPLLS